MVVSGPKGIPPAKMNQLLAAAKGQVSEEDYERLQSLLADLQIFGLSAYLNAEIGKIMSGIQWELKIEESPEFGEALTACDEAFLGEELKDMCRDAGLSPRGHKKVLCARLYEAKVPEIVEIIEPYLEKVENLPQTTLSGFYVIERGICPYCHKSYAKGDYIMRWSYFRGPKNIRGRGVHVSCYHQLEKEYPEPEQFPQAIPLYQSSLRDITERLEELHRTAPDEFYRRKRIIEKAIEERQRGNARTMPGFTLGDLQEILKSAERLYREEE